MNKNKIVKAISVLLVFLLCVGIFAMVAKFTNGFTEDFKTFYVTYNGKKLFSFDNQFFLEREEEHRFDVTYVFEFLDDDEDPNREYSVKIIPNVDDKTDFTFTVDGDEYAYSEVGELTKGFLLDKQDTYFVLSVTNDTCLESVLEGVYGKDVDTPKDEYCPSPYLYTLVITSYDESITYFIDFAIGKGVTEIELDTDKVVI